MRNELQVLQAALGNPEFRGGERKRERDVGKFLYVETDLIGQTYRGFPPRWDFAVLLDSDSSSEIKGTISDAIRLVERAQKEITSGQLVAPLVIVSDDPHVRLNDALPHHVRNIFWLDHSEIPTVKYTSTKPMFAPFVKAVRHRLTRREMSALMFSPYIRNHPVAGWRFFGRKKELDLLVNSEETFFVVGGRRIGKTSLLQETDHQLSARGYSVVFVDVERCENERDVVTKILQAVSPKDAEAAVRRHKAIDEPLLASLLRRLTSGKKVVLILDELGNVISKLPREQWRIFGTLREFVHSNKLKIIASCFQEIFLRQQSDFAGPLVNFGTTLRLRALSANEVEEMVVAPLEHWGQISNSRALLELITGTVGRHPYLLQTFCHELFQRVLQEENKDVLAIAKSFWEKDSEFTECFRDAVEELFNRALTPLLRYLFLSRCHEINCVGGALADADFDDDWLESTLETVGYRSTLDGRRAILDELEMRGLTEPRSDRRQTHAVIAPAIYLYHKKSNLNVPKILDKFAKEIEIEHQRWGLLKK